MQKAREELQLHCTFDSFLAQNGQLVLKLDARESNQYMEDT